MEIKHSYDLHGTQHLVVKVLGQEFWLTNKDFCSYDWFSGEDESDCEENFDRLRTAETLKRITEPLRERIAFLEDQIRIRDRLDERNGEPFTYGG